MYASETLSAQVQAAVPDCVCVKSRAELVAKTATPGAIALVDIELLDPSEGDLTNVPTIGLVEDTSDALLQTILIFDTFPWLSHVAFATLFSAPNAKTHLALLFERLLSSPERAEKEPMLGETGVGRVALLAASSRREQRFERMREFFAKQGLSSRTITTINDVAEELVTNALYDAPVEAGYFGKAIPRTEQVELPPDRACEISYGVEDGMVLLRLRDTFGALKRDRLLKVLNRCSARTVVLDESRGGAGLGLWRVFSAASTISITVLPGRLTDIQLGIATQSGRVVKQLLTVDLFFAPPNGPLDALIPDDAGLMDNSVTLVRVA